MDYQQDGGDEHSLEYIHRLNERKPAALKIQLSVNVTQLEMELDTGASCAVISEETYRKIWGPNPPSLRDTSTVLRAYGGKAIPLLGVLPVQVKANTGDKPQALQLHVVREKEPTLPGPRLAIVHSPGLGRNLQGRSGPGIGP